MKALAREVAEKKIPALELDRWAVDADLAHLEGLTGLRKLDLSRTKITDAGVEQLSALPELGDLNLVGTQITGTGLTHLETLANLRVLTLGGAYLQDDVIAGLAGVTQLEFLFLRGLSAEDQVQAEESRQLTDEGLKHLSELKNLIVLDIQNTDQFVKGLRATHVAGSFKQFVAGPHAPTDLGCALGQKGLEDRARGILMDPVRGACSRAAERLFEKADTDTFRTAELFQRSWHPELVLHHFRKQREPYRDHPIVARESGDCLLKELVLGP